MSRTDVHRPWPVQVSDATNRHLFYRYPAWPWQMDLAPIRNLACGCRMCTGHHARRLARRQERVAWRSIRQQLVKVAPQDRDDIDVPPITRKAW